METHIHSPIMLMDILSLIHMEAFTQIKTD